ncbi:hypothetical protein B0H13DRAFT_2302222 [Mycena leptocephala]|nr:hypothetical protein B0H13DRAFT_2302222 [Mycena leptocephala]
MLYLIGLSPLPLPVNQRLDRESFGPFPPSMQSPNAYIVFRSPAAPAYLELQWAAVILAKTAGVALNNPPPDKMFPPIEGNDDVDDIAALARRRNQPNQANKSTSPAITINNDLTGLAQLLRPQNSPFPSTPAHSQASASMIRNPSPLKPTQMSFDAFCRSADLPDIPTKLEILEITGPHLLQYIENEVLDKHISVGQRPRAKLLSATVYQGCLRDMVRSINSEIQ